VPQVEPCLGGQIIASIENPCAPGLVEKNGNTGFYAADNPLSESAGRSIVRTAHQLTAIKVSFIRA
jgi:hypothetical protein